MRSSVVASRRCRPLLGTFVEIELDHARSSSGIEEGLRAFEAGFRAVEEVATAMSFHDSESELSTLNQAPVRHWVPVSGSVHEVLSYAQELKLLTGGHFNVSVGTPLIYQGILPGQVKAPDWNALNCPDFELRSGRARRLAPVQIDLGGIAKGYAVDRAVESILAINARFAGVVNAGGDLKVFGRRSRRVALKSGPRKNPAFREVRIRNLSIASSRVERKGVASAYVRPKRGTFLLKEKSVSVMADQCMVADALTKVALMCNPRQVEAIFRSQNATLLWES